MSLFSRRNGNQPRLKKSHYYVCFLGAKESGALKGPRAVMPVLASLIPESAGHAPMKMTLQISEKGMKIIQTIPLINKSGKIKMDVLKFLVPHYSISFAMVAPPPHDDVLAAILLIYNPETRCPVHVHCYRCDSPKTAALMNCALQTLILRPENVKRFAELDQRLRLRGLLPEPDPQIDPFYFPQKLPPLDSYRDQETSTTLDRMLRSSSPCFDMMGEDPEQERVNRLHRAVFQELKEKLRNRDKCPILIPPKDYLSTMQRYTRLNRRPSFPSYTAIYDDVWSSSNQASTTTYGYPSSKTRPSHGDSSSTSGVGSESSSNERSKMSPSDSGGIHLIGYRRAPNSQSPFAGDHTANQRRTASYFDINESVDASSTFTRAPKPPAIPLRRFGDTIKFSQSANTQRSPVTLIGQSKWQPPADEPRPPPPTRANWLSRANKFFSMEDLSAAGRHRGSVFEHEPLRESLWHLPSLVDPFGKICEQTPELSGFSYTANGVTGPLKSRSNRDLSQDYKYYASSRYNS